MQKKLLTISRNVCKMIVMLGCYVTELFCIWCNTGTCPSWLLPKQSISHHQPEVQDWANDGRRHNIGLVIGHQNFASIIDCMWSSSPQLGFYSHCLFSWPTDTATTARNIEVRVSYLWQNGEVGPDLQQMAKSGWLLRNSNCRYDKGHRCRTGLYAHDQNHSLI